MTTSRNVLEPRYFDRMAAALGDKMRLLEWVLPGKVIDVGAGGGELSAALAQRAGVRELYALDDAPDAIDRLTGITGVHGVRGSFGETLETLPGGPADTIVCCSVLHEVYSYGGGWNAVELALTSCAASLRVGGRLIVRDGVMPDMPAAGARMSAPDDELVRNYLKRCPWPELQLHQAATGEWYGTRHAISEALCTLTWGPGSLPREAQERYQLATLDRYPEFLSLCGFQLVHDEEYTQPGYVENLGGYTVETMGTHWWEPWFPPTNAIWVYERVSS